MKHLLLTCLLCQAAVCRAEPPAPIELTVEKAVDMALTSNVSLINAEKTVRIFDQKVKEYWANAYPAINVSGSYTRNLELPAFFFMGSKVSVGMDNAYAASAELTQTLWAGGKVKTGIQIADITSKSTSEQYKSARILVAKNVRLLCYDIMLAATMIDIQQESHDLSKKHLDQINEQYRQGIASDLVVLRQEVEVSNSEPAVIKAQNDHEVAMLNLKNILGRDPEDNIKLADDSPLSDENYEIEALYAKALAKRPEVVTARLNYELSDKQIQLARSEFFPYITAFINRSYQGQSNSLFPSSDQTAWSSAAGARLQLPLFSGGGTVSRIKQAELARVQAFNSLKETQRLAKIDVKKAWLDLQHAKQALKAQEGAVSQARKALAATEIRFKNGLAGHLDLSDATLALNTSRMQYVQSMYYAYSALAELKWATGE